MPMYRLRVHATATIEENWVAEGATPEEAFERLLVGDAEFENDLTVGDETDRELVGFMDISDQYLRPDGTPVGKEDA